jgi:hypothetical protein
MRLVAAAGCALVICVLIPSAVNAQDATEPKRPLSVPEYISAIDSIAATLEGSAGNDDDLPKSWRVEGDRRVFEIPTDSVARDLRRWWTTRDVATYARLIAQLQTLRSEADAFQRPAADVSRLRGLAIEILNGREFKSVHGPSWIDRVRQRVFRLLNRLFAGVMESSAFPTISRALVYILLAAAGLTAALWLSKFRRRALSAGTESISAHPAAPQTVAWTHWLTQAEAAAAAGSWRDAIHFSYWCAVSFLEANGAWSADRTRTPREYVRLLPASSGDRSALSALTRLFERVWYGTATADADAFAEMTTHLKELGCLTG